MRTHVMEDFKSIGNSKPEVFRSSVVRFIENMSCSSNGKSTEQLFYLKKRGSDDKHRFP